MSIVVYPVTPSFAAEVGGVDLSKPLTVADLAAIEAAFWKYATVTDRCDSGTAKCDLHACA